MVHNLKAFEAGKHPHVEKLGKSRLDILGYILTTTDSTYSMFIVELQHLMISKGGIPDSPCLQLSSR